MQTSRNAVKYSSRALVYVLVIIVHCLMYYKILLLLCYIILFCKAYQNNRCVFPVNYIIGPEFLVFAWQYQGTVFATKTVTIHCSTKIHKCLPSLHIHLKRVQQ